MREHLRVTTPSARPRILIGILLGSVALAMLLAGRLAVSVFVAVLSLAAYFDARRLLDSEGHAITFVLGGAGTAGFLWCGYAGRLDLLPAVGGALILSLLVARIGLYERGVTSSVTSDLAYTLGAAAVIGVLGAHVLLLRAVPHFGFRGLVAFGLMVLLNDAVAFLVGRSKGKHALARHVSPGKTWEGALAGFAASILVGLVVGLVFDPPFGPVSGVVFGAAVGVLVPLGDLCFSVVKRSAGVRHSGSYLGAAGGALDVMDSVLFVAPAFYWAFRTIAL